MTRTIKTGNAQERFVDSMRAAGIKYNSRSWTDYEKAKKLIPAEAQESREWEKYIRWATSFIGI